ncbi:hypothetical protein, conserved in T. vivax [Trypanosoma vivax Y486]|uniref:Uncharacterized protein n=1 Tax=Trypanosoma vivax (strain Y486) TaxID=1055687 RepID=F9WPE7_TRYVY|nr:hypothetical protein, conserved in T. vivax [Trypanosoma vivax Y486]|eukprot:CCD19424.1 hypothetical protein, conserved in T. vivax [Trypanosoma vivax Y486]
MLSVASFIAIKRQDVLSRIDQEGVERESRIESAIQAELCMIAMKERNDYSRIVMNRVEKQGRRERPEANTIDRAWIKKKRLKRAIIESAIRAEWYMIAMKGQPDYSRIVMNRVEKQGRKESHEENRIDQQWIKKERLERAVIERAMKAELCMIVMKERNDYERIVMNRVEKQGRKEEPEADTIARKWIKKERLERAIIESAIQAELCMIAMKERNDYNRIVMNRVEKQGRKERPEATTIDQQWIKKERLERAMIESAMQAGLCMIVVKEQNDYNRIVMNRVEKQRTERGKHGRNKRERARDRGPRQTRLIGSELNGEDLKER